MMGLSAEQAEPMRQREREEVPLGRRGLPEEVAQWIVSFANSGNEWVTGQIFGVDGGLGLT
jgi:NAD(P)-dependent dehydrogenase (short-subunit alcohol dehydrogenase family)